LTQHLFDADNRETVTIDALSNRTTSLLDAAGIVTGVKDALGNLTQFLFDADNRQTVTVDALSNRTTTLLDAAGNVSGQLDAKNHLTQFLLDADNRKTVTIDALNYRTTVLLDALGNMTMLKDASSNSTSFLYDADNRLTSQTDQLGHAGTMAYDAVGRQTSVTDRDGRIRNYFYDAVGHVTGQTWYTTGGTSVTANITMLYDAAGNITLAAANYGAYTMMYDALNRVTVAQEPFNQTLTMGYDAASNRTTVQDKFGTETSIYDADNRLQTREYAGISTTKVREDLTYQANDVLSTAKRYSDLTASTQVGATTMLYDAASRVTAINDFNGSGTALVSQTYLMDAVGNITHEVDNGSRTLDYTYDSDNQLTADSLNTFTYDGTGNRNNTGWSTPAGNENELQSDAIAGGTWAYAYDPEGNVIKKSLGISADTWIYEYDDANHMTVAQEYTKDPTNGGVIIQEWDSEYDAFGNRIDYFEHVGGSTEQRYSLDGWDPPTQGATGNAKWEVYADLDGTSSLTTRYLRGDEVDQLFARIGSDGTVAWLLTDHLGSVVGVTDNSGVLKDTLLYDAWGNITSESTPSQGGRYKWTGREEDTGTGLQENRGRMYDALTSRWLSQDPIGFSAGDSNLYRYVHDAPMDFVDPSGLDTAPPMLTPAQQKDYQNYVDRWYQEQADRQTEIGRNLNLHPDGGPQLAPNIEQWWKKRGQFRNWSPMPSAGTFALPPTFDPYDAPADTEQALSHGDQWVQRLQNGTIAKPTLPNQKYSAKELAWLIQAKQSGLQVNNDGKGKWYAKLPPSPVDLQGGGDGLPEFMDSSASQKARLPFDADLTPSERLVLKWNNLEYWQNTFGPLLKDLITEIGIGLKGIYEASPLKTLVNAIDAGMDALEEVLGRFRKGDIVGGLRAAGEYYTTTQLGIADAALGMTVIVPLTSAIMREEIGFNALAVRNGWVSKERAEKGAKIGAGAFEVAMVILPVAGELGRVRPTIRRSAQITLESDGSAVRGRFQGHLYDTPEEAIQAARRSIAPANAVDFSGELTRDRGNATRSLRNALGTNSQVERPHHIVPWEAGQDPATRSLLEAAGRGGFNINGANNGVNLRLQVHPQGARHPRYNAAVMKQLRALAQRNLTDAQAAAELQAIADRLRPGLQRLNQSGQPLR
jgi:RHS repeat-associated protein